ncbi:MAG: flavin reductase family protein [Campylobacteraceae bacterium]|jgi:flavin reductase (DIM6/NTAB) family NADH-FMN oxidoreductase RutF|nr:flavin reductase family protein [Campylobacteraceae bacterium]
MQQTKAVKASKLWQEKNIITDFDSSPIRKISQEWIALSSGTKDEYNTMTASWGALGYLWERSIAIVYVRPTRHTYDLMEKQDCFTLTFFDKSLKAKVHKIFGNKSGRNIDKAKEAAVTPIYFDENIIGFEEAKETIVCKKIYFGDFNPNNFLDKEINNFYPAKDYHRVYIGEIKRFYKKSEIQK